MANKRKGFEFQTEAITLVTPEATTLFMCLAEVNEYTEQFGGKLLFTKEDMETKIKYKVGKGKEQIGKFGDILTKMVDDASAEVGKAVYKVKNNIGQNDTPTGLIELSCKNQKQPRIVNPDRTVEKDFTTLIANGSKVKAQLYLKPYSMQGKTGITAYLNSVLLVDIIEYGNNDMFSDDDFDGGDGGEDTTTDDF